MGRKKPFVDKKTAATYTLVFKSGQDGDEVNRVFVRTDDGPACVPGFGDEEDERRSRIAGDADSSDGSFAGYWAGSRPQEPPLSAEQRQELVDAGFPDDGYNYLRHLRSISDQGTFLPAVGLTLNPLAPDVKVYAASAEGGAAKAVTGRRFQDVEDDKDFEAQTDEEIEDDFVMIANEGGEGARGSTSEGGDGARGSASGYDEAEVSEGDEEDAWGEEAEDRPSRDLDLQFEKLVLDEYEDDGSDEDGVVPDFEVDNSVLEEALAELTTDRQYETPAGLASKRNGEDEVSAKGEGLYGVKGAGARLVPEKFLFEDEESDHEVVLEEVSDREEEWDCETIVSTFSNLDNHPATIDDGPVRRKKLQTVVSEGENRPTIRLGGRQKLPLDYVGKKSVEKPRNKAKLPAIHEPPSSDETPSQGDHGSSRRDSPEDRKAHKAAVKAERREARIAKKALKLQYKAESKRIQHGAAQAVQVAIHL